MKKVILASVLALAGCATGPDNVDGLKSTGYKDQFTVNLGYQQVYRNIKNGFTKCGGMQSRWLKPFNVDAELYTDIHEGQFTVNTAPTVASPKPVTHIMIKEKTANNSTVTVFFSWQGHVKEGGQIYRRWANGNLACE